ncbi:hypothetical protein V496_01460 [Pseudogymnoascus sp. VKM F-4515 (FW-2607)]|nr:hypothetical protein V496_01460 [Pseudogymnoascus sp. VKM F-4515 (FW-2607)]
MKTICGGVGECSSAIVKPVDGRPSFKLWWRTSYNDRKLSIPSSTRKSDSASQLKIDYGSSAHPTVASLLNIISLASYRGARTSLVSSLVSLLLRQTPSESICWSYAAIIAGVLSSGCLSVFWRRRILNLVVDVYRQTRARNRSDVLETPLGRPRCVILPAVVASPSPMKAANSANDSFILLTEFSSRVAQNSRIGRCFHELWLVKRHSGSSQIALFSLFSCLIQLQVRIVALGQDYSVAQ